MTPKFSLVTAVAGAALLLAVPAWGQSQPPIVSPDAVDRAVAQKQASTTSTYLDAYQRTPRVDGVQSTPTISPDAFERAVAARGGGTLDRFVANDNRFQPVPSNDPVSVSATGSGRELDWPQLGIGFGIGIALILGLLLAMRATRQRQLAH